MVVETKIFGEVEIADDKIITLEKGIIGFPDLKHFALIHNVERKDARVAYMVSMEEPAFALPVIDPLVVKEDFNPIVDDDYLKPLGELDPEEMLVLVTLTVPRNNVKAMSVNLKAPIIVNAKERKACQIILEGSEYEIKYPIYDILQKLKNEEGK